MLLQVHLIRILLVYKECGKDAISENMYIQNIRDMELYEIFALGLI